MVTATLRFAGDQLSIELQVENREAYHRLVTDSDTIIGSLRDIGYDVDRVTVLQPAAAARPDSASSLPSRSFEQSGSGMAQGDASDSGERASRQGENHGQNSSREDQKRPDPAREGSTGLYI
jgi:chemotaxis protein MotD